MILPGESISKYRGLNQTRPVSPSASERTATPVQDQPAQPIAEIFADDEPIFAAAPPATAETQPREEISATPVPAQADEVSSDWDREQQRLHQMNVAAVFGGEAAEDDDDDQEAADESDDRLVVVAGPSEAASTAAEGRVEEEEIEEEEADLAHYVEDLEEDAAFEELEEETHAAGEHEQPAREIAASAETSSADAVPFSPEPVSSEEIDVAAADEVDEEAEDEAELDEAQAEAEAVLAAEAGGTGMTEARAEVRAPAGTAGYTQRAPRPGYDRRPQRGGRRGGGGGRRVGRRAGAGDRIPDAGRAGYSQRCLPGRELRRELRSFRCLRLRRPGLLRLPPGPHRAPLRPRLLRQLHRPPRRRFLRGNQFRGKRHSVG